MSAKCPKCGAEIDELNLYVRGETKSRFMLDSEGNGQSWECDFNASDSEDEDFECPDCSEVLTHDWDEAVRILKGLELEHDPEKCGCRYLGMDMWSCGHIDNNTSC